MQKCDDISIYDTSEFFLYWLILSLLIMIYDISYDTSGDWQRRWRSFIVYLQYLRHVLILSNGYRCRSPNNDHIDYRCADDRFLMSPRGITVSNTKYLSSSETRVNADIKGWKWHLSKSNWCQESVGAICFTNKWSVASLQPLTFSNYCSNAVFSNASSGLTVRFLGVNIGVFWKRESRPIEWRQYRLSTRKFFFFCLHIYSLWTIKGV
jgi:hypothetical protein